MAPYGTNEGLQLWLDQNGLTVPDGLSPEILRSRATSYLDAVYGPSLSGEVADPFTQDEAWPRVAAVMNKRPVPDGLIPPQVIAASYRAAYLEGVTPGVLASLSATPVGPRAKRQKAGEVEREFFDDGVNSMGNSAVFIDPIIDRIMRQFFKPYDDAPILGFYSIGGSDG